MSLLQKRKKTESNLGRGLAESDKTVLEIIKNNGEDAIGKHNLKKETKLPATIVTKSIKNLISLSLIKEIPHANSKEKHYIAAEFNPSNTVTGGVWYLNGELDTVFIDQLKDLCFKIVKKLKVATVDGVYEFFKKNNLTNTDCTRQQISEIMRAMVLENLIIEVKSSGHGEYHSIPVGNVCYRCPAADLTQGPGKTALGSVPCGVCPRIRECTPGGLISPSSCAYFTKWLDF